MKPLMVKAALVTGASCGVGKDVAIAFGRALVIANPAVLTVFVFLTH
jgi:NADP-dependent 3-hydroxy acid dehydrogenase YdfG